MSDRRCPCGSGLLRSACDPAELSLCRWGDCDAIYHRHSNRHMYCAVHAAEARREAKARSARRRTQRNREARELAVEQAAAAKRQRPRSLPEQTTMDVTL